MKEYTVKPGDSLSKIAGRQLGDSSRWRELAEINGIRNPAAIRVGQVIRIPVAEPAPNVINEGSERNQAAADAVTFHVEGKTVFAIHEGRAKEKRGCDDDPERDPRSR